MLRRAQYIELEEASDKEPHIWSYWMAAQAHLSNH